MALRLPAPDRYHVLPGDAWHVILAHHRADHRVYLARAQHQRHYAAGDLVAPPTVPPATLLACWEDPDARLAFMHVGSPAQRALLMYASTADHHIYVPPEATPRGLASTYTPCVPLDAALAGDPA